MLWRTVNFPYPGRDLRATCRGASRAGIRWTPCGKASGYWIESELRYFHRVISITYWLRSCGIPSYDRKPLELLLLPLAFASQKLLGPQGSPAPLPHEPDSVGRALAITFARWRQSPASVVASRHENVAFLWLLELGCLGKPIPRNLGRSSSLAGSPKR
jgi:hypothetical protein